jgi:hypothetical protein
MSRSILKYVKNILSTIWEKTILAPLCLQGCDCQNSCGGYSKCENDTTPDTKTCQCFDKKD